MNNGNLRDLVKKSLSRRGFFNIKRIAWVWERDIIKRQRDILRKHCDVNPKPLVDPITGEIDFRYNP